MSRTGYFTILLLLLILTFSSCARITESYIPYSASDFPVLEPLDKNDFSQSVAQEEMPDINDDNPVITEYIPPAPPEEYVNFTLNGIHDDVLLQETEDAGQAYVDGTCFIGDSITLGLKVFKILPESRVYSEGSIDPYAAGHNKIVTLPDGRKVTAPQAVGYYKPERVVITLGTNSVSWCPESSFIASYGQLIEDIRAESPQTDIIIQAIPPVSESYEATAVKLTNKTINRFNTLLVGLAKEKSVYFLNTASVLKNERGYFNDNYQSGDGLHHNQACYKIWLEYLRTHAIPA